VWKLWWLLSKPRRDKVFPEAWEEPRRVAGMPVERKD